MTNYRGPKHSSQLSTQWFTIVFSLHPSIDHHVEAFPVKCTSDFREDNLKFITIFSGEVLIVHRWPWEDWFNWLWLRFGGNKFQSKLSIDLICFFFCSRFLLPKLERQSFTKQTGELHWCCVKKFSKNQVNESFYLKA
jgi:hypothetical protein